MRARAAALIGAGCIASALFLSACDEGREGKRQQEREPPAETIDPLPELPPGWAEHVNRQGGFAIGVPPGWSARARGPRSELRSPERLAALSISADRTSDATEAPLERFAAATLKAGLPGVHKLETARPREFRHPYQAVSVEGTGVVGADEVREDLKLVLIRRDALATYTALVAQNAERAPGLYTGLVDEMLATLRGRPIRR